MVKKLIIANAVVFGLQLFAQIGLGWQGLGISSPGGGQGITLQPIGMYFALVPEMFVESGFIWTLVSYQFLHGGFFHILINMFILWMFGTEVERLWDEFSFLQFYLVCGLAAGMAMVVVNYGRSPESLIPVVGASGSIFGLLGAFGYYWPDREVFIMGIFPMKTKYFIMFIAGFELLISISETQLGVANIAHLGGLGMGLIYVRYLDPKSSIFDSFKKWVRKRKVKKKKDQWRRREKKREEMVQEADEILDRLKDMSWEELSDDEKRRIREISDELDDL
ncbi:MAG: rhomboid family intramembrane serine protease [bacterium]